jgi:hypothetical protein
MSRDSLFIEWISSGGKVSSKRIATAIALFSYLTFAGFEQFFKFKANPAYMEGLMYIVISGLGLTASEKFSKSKGNEDKQVREPERGS